MFSVILASAAIAYGTGVGVISYKLVNNLPKKKGKKVIDVVINDPVMYDVDDDEVRDAE
jgi:hypothetical protein